MSNGKDPIKEWLIKFNQNQDLKDALLKKLEDIPIPSKYKKMDKRTLYRGIPIEKIEDVDPETNFYSDLSKTPSMWTSKYDEALNVAKMGRYGIVLEMDFHEDFILVNMNNLKEDYPAELAPQNDCIVIVRGPVGTAFIVERYNF